MNIRITLLMLILFTDNSIIYKSLRYGYSYINIYLIHIINIANLLFILYICWFLL